MANAEKSLRIVYRRSLEQYAQYLETLIGEDAGVDASVWNEKEYQDCKRTMPEDVLVLFLGDSLARDEFAAEMTERYAASGIRWGMGGRHAYILASEEPITGRKKSRAFLDWLRETHPEFTDDDYAALDAENADAWRDSLKASVNPFASVLDSVFRKPVSSAGSVSAIGDLQWRAAVMEFYKNGLPAFLAN